MTSAARNDPADNASPTQVLRFNACRQDALGRLLGRYGLSLERLDDPVAEIPGSYWGAEEAGIVRNCVWVRNDTPLHSVLHEACHFVCMDPGRREGLDTDAGGDYEEENGVCYLQILLADQLPDMSRERMMGDMDDWGYTFRLGSAAAWFSNDARDAFDWLLDHGIVDERGTPTWRLRDGR